MGVSNASLDSFVFLVQLLKVSGNVFYQLGWLISIFVVVCWINIRLIFLLQFVVARHVMGYKRVLDGDAFPEVEDHYGFVQQV